MKIFSASKSITPLKIKRVRVKLGTTTDMERMLRVQLVALEEMRSVYQELAKGAKLERINSLVLMAQEALLELSELSSELPKKDITLSMPVGGGGGFSRPLEEAIISAGEKGILFVAAAGNSGRDNGRYPHYPSNYPGAFSVASLDPDGRLSSFSNYSSTYVDVAAPGRSILSTWNSQGVYRTLNGTSMATPHVAGLAALLYSQHYSMEPNERLKKSQENLEHLRKEEASG